MTLERCIDDLAGAGKLTDEQAQRARFEFARTRDAYDREMGRAQAELFGARDAVDNLKREALEAKRQALLQLLTQSTILKNIDGFRNSRGRRDDGLAAITLFDRDDRADFSNLHIRREEVRGRAHARMVSVLSAFRRDLAGRGRQRARQDNMVREVFGQGTDDASAREMAQAWTGTAEWLRQRFNRAGGRIPKRKDWGLPQAHDSLAVRKVSFDEWRNEVLPRLDLAKMLDERTGKGFTPESIETVLREVKEAMDTDGMSKIIPSGNSGGRKLANRRLDHRFLVFKSADDWLAYHNRFGQGDPFDVMMSHIDGMARDIAALEILGPNPAATVRWLGQVLRQRASRADAKAGSKAATNKARRATFQVEQIYGHFMGTLNSPVNETMARGFASARAFITATRLGSAVLSAVGDVAFGALTARFNGMPATSVLRRQISLLNPANAADRETAVRLGLIAEEWSQIGAAHQRYGDDFNTPEFARRMADFTLRVSGLSAWTQAGRWAFGMELTGHLAAQSGKSLDQLDRATARMLRRYGIGEDSWNAIRATPALEHNGARFLRPEDIEARLNLPEGVARQLATRLLEMIRTETEFAVPTASLRARSVLTASARPGTFLGEIVRSGFQFKAFAVTIVHTHLMRALTQQGLASKAQYAAALMVGGTVMGGLALQLKDIAAGRDPRPMTDAEFWGAALVQGGGLGIYGDFLFASENRFGGGLAQTLLGPGVGLAQDTLSLTIGNAAQAIRGDDPKLARDLMRFARANNPASSIWYTKLAFDRLVIDQLHKQLDPDAERQFRRMERRRAREFGQEFFFRPGDTRPARAPDLANIGEIRQ